MRESVILSAIRDKCSRECGRCGLEVLLSDFPRGARADGTHSYCKPCYNEYKRRRYEINREREIARVREWIEANRDRHNANVRASNSRAHVKERSKAYVRSVPELRKIYDANKKHKRRAAAGAGVVTPGEWREIVRQCDGRCFYCLEVLDTITMDHFIPLSRGGEHSASNVVPACKRCNGQKWAYLPMDYMKRIGRA